jgi:DMSO/TMAO reductase YedYZ heme-binding membrane subunit
MVLIAAAVADGLLFSGRATPRRRRPAWWMDLHRGLGGYALVFTGLHLVTAYGADLGVGLAEVFVPGAAEASTTAYTLGALAFYGLLVTVLSSWPKRRLRRRSWHLLHVLSVPAGIAAGVHAYQLGTDALTGWYLALTLLMTFGVSYPLALRLIGVVRRRSDGPGRTALSTASTAGTAGTVTATSGAAVRPGAITLGDPLLPERELAGSRR